jgi:hypothetical protein
MCRDQRQDVVLVFFSQQLRLQGRSVQEHELFVAVCLTELVREAGRLGISVGVINDGE